MLETKDHILKVAFILFLKNGYKSVSMHDLERETGLTKGAFYHYFKGKEDIFIEVINKYHLSQRKNALSDFEATCTFSEFIDYQIKDIGLQVNEIRNFANIEDPDPFFISLIMEARKYYPGFTDKVKESSVLIIKKWENKIKQAQEKFEIRPDIDPYIMAESMISIGMSMFKYLMVKETPEFALNILKQQYYQVYSLLKL